MFSASDHIDVLEFGTCRVYLCALPASLPGDRRKAEQCAVRRLVAEAFGPGAVYSHDENGAPLVRGADGYVSVSHCADCAVLAVDSERPVGVDVELSGDRLRRVARRFLDDREYEFCDGDMPRLLKAWTAKEAVFKAAGDASLTVGAIHVDQPSSVAVVPSGARFTLVHTLMRAGDGLRTLCLAWPEKTEKNPAREYGQD